MNPEHRPILRRIWRILRMTLGLIFAQRGLWVVVKAADEEDAVYAARNACPFPGALLGITVVRLPGYHDQWRVQYIYEGQKK